MNKKQKSQGNPTVFDVVVVGSGPAGMMAAAGAARRGKSVLLLEKNNTLGKKLLISGGGRFNVTNNKPVVREMLRQYGDATKFLFSTFTQYGVVETIDFFTKNNTPLHEENEGRMFPDSNTAQSIWDVLHSQLVKHGVKIRTKQAASLITRDENTSLITVHFANGDTVFAQSVVLATGGTSRPETGSTGEGFMWLKELGHSVRLDDYS